MVDTGERSRYFQELTLNLRHEGFTVKPETAEGLLPVELDGRPLCRVAETGDVRYWKRDVTGDDRDKAKGRVVDIAKITAGYMRQMEAAPFLKASGLTRDYRLLADFNGVVMAGHPTEYGVQFVTWEWVQNRTALWQGHYYDGLNGYTAAKQDFVVRSGLVPGCALFVLEQLTEVYRSISETLESAYPMTDERRKCLKSTAEQIETAVPDLAERVALSIEKDVKSAEMLFPQDSGTQFI